MNHRWSDRHVDERDEWDHPKASFGASVAIGAGAAVLGVAANLILVLGLDTFADIRFSGRLDIVAALVLAVVVMVILKRRVGRRTDRWVEALVGIGALALWALITSAGWL